MKKSLVSILIGLFMVGVSGDVWAGNVVAAGLNCTNPAGCVQTNEISDGAVNDTKITGPISATKIKKLTNVIVVAQSGGDFTTITDALASLPDPNMTPVIIKVMPGTYQEGWIDMKSYVNLQGSGRDVTTIEGDIIIAWGTSVTDVTISGFKISGGYIKNDGSLTPDQKVIITGNYITGTPGEALNLWACSPYFTVSDNIIAGNGRGIAMTGCRATIRNNTINGNGGEGIWNGGDTGGFSSDAVIADNVIFNNGSNGIYNSGNSKALIRDNVISNNGNNGIYNTGASPTIVGNTIANNGGSGIYLPDSTTDSVPIIKGNLISNNGIVDTENAAGILIANSPRAFPTVESNIIDGNPYGIQNASYPAIIKNNTIRNSIYSGIITSWSIAKPFPIIGNHVTGNNTSQSQSGADMNTSYNPVSHNVFDTYNANWYEPITPVGNFNVKSDGTTW